MELQSLWIEALVLIMGVGIGYFVRVFAVSLDKNSLEQKLKTRRQTAETEANKIVLEAQEKSVAILEDVKKEEKERKTQLDKHEERLLERGGLLERQSSDLARRESDVVKAKEGLAKREAELSQISEKAMGELERISGLSKETARRELTQSVQEAYKNDMLQLVYKLEHEKREEVEKKSLDIITTALQRYARGHVSELTTTSFTLPNEEIKGKIIGREGRNIKAFERATGVEVLIDETPETLVISSFDPYRRELAKLALTKLIKDGRIQPAKIEEAVELSRGELQKRIQEIGDAAAFDLGIVDLPKEITQLLGRLHFRTSYGQNVLAHSIEMAYIAGMIAAELGARIDVAKKGALLHDIGKAIDHEVEGTHIELGRKILKKYGVAEPVIQAMESHHDDYPYAIPEAFIVTTADILSGARPGARRDNVEDYLKRLGDLEKVASGFEGVKQAYALSAGREVRVFVIPEKIDDFGALQLAKDIASKIQSELKYPGEIKVNVIREMRAVEYAK